MNRVETYLFTLDPISEDERIIYSSQKIRIHFSYIAIMYAMT